LAHGFTDGKVHVVARNAYLALTHPNLEKAWVNVHQCRTPKKPNYFRRSAIPQIQQQIRLGG
jgi:hypothetical protein